MLLQLYSRIFYSMKTVANFTKRYAEKTDEGTCTICKGKFPFLLVEKKIMDSRSSINTSRGVMMQTAKIGLSLK